MKKIALLVLGISLFFGCEKKDDIAFQPPLEKPISSKSTESINKSSFKKEITIFDDDKKNSLKVLISASKEEYLNSYLSNFDLKITSSKTKKKSKKETLQENPILDPEKVMPIDIDNMQDLIKIENVEKNMAQDITSYSLIITPKKILSGAKVASFTFAQWYESNLFDDWLQVTNIGNISSGNSIVDTQFQYRLCGLCGWKTAAFQILYPQGSNVGFNWWRCTVDARRLGVVVRGDNSSIFRVDYGNW